MKCKIISLILFTMITFTNTAFATQWAYVCKSSDNMQTMYVDRDSAAKNNDTAIFWELVVLYEPDPNGVKKILYKKQANKQQMERQLEEYDYKTNNELHWNDIVASNWSSYFSGTIEECIVNAAFKYAKEGKDTGQKPSLRN